MTVFSVFALSTIFLLVQIGVFLSSILGSLLCVIYIDETIKISNLHGAGNGTLCSCALIMLNS